MGAHHDRGRAPQRGRRREVLQLLRADCNRAAGDLRQGDIDVLPRNDLLAVGPRVGPGTLLGRLRRAVPRGQGVRDQVRAQALHEYAGEQPARRPRPGQQRDAAGQRLRGRLHRVQRQGRLGNAAGGHRHRVCALPRVPVAPPLPAPALPRRPRRRRAGRGGEGRGQLLRRAARLARAGPVPHHLPALPEQQRDAVQFRRDELAVTEAMGAETLGGLLPAGRGVARLLGSREGKRQAILEPEGAPGVSNVLEVKTETQVPCTAPCCRTWDL
mmetsp:Transcript_42165/g.113314  ORF Transcript_42165/g.113314 Transcript_42165/m.113314 type:complete len:271 (+) Transcript_42165:1656-2468(+)